MKKIICFIMAVTMSMSLCISAFAVSDEESYSEKEVTSENGNGFLKASHKPVAPTGLPYQAVVAGLSEGAGTYSKCQISRRCSVVIDRGSNRNGG